MVVLFLQLSLSDLATHSIPSIRWGGIHQCPVRIYRILITPSDSIVFSGGEHQHLAASSIFMCIASDRTKLVMADEPTSAMDPEGELRLFDGLREGKTMIFVTHRCGHLTNMLVSSCARYFVLSIWYSRNT